MQTSLLYKCLKFGSFWFISKGCTGENAMGQIFPKFLEPLGAETKRQI